MTVRKLTLATMVALSTMGAALALSSTAALAVPDGRVYEAVSPVEDPDFEAYVPLEFARRADFYGANINGESIHYGMLGEHPFEASAEGSRVAYMGAPGATGNGERGNARGNEFVATRGAGGWSQADVQPPGYKAAYFNGFSTDLSVGILTAPSSQYLPPLTPEAPGAEDKVPYARENVTGVYRPLFTVTPPDLSGEGFGTWEGPEAGTPQAPLFAGASASFEELLFEANDALAPNATFGGREANNLYVSSAGIATAVNVLPGATTSQPGASFGGPPLNETNERPDFDNVISSDGSQIFWSTVSPKALYVRENAQTPGAVTVQVDSAQGGSGSSGGGQFWAATPTGSVVFFTDESQLTEGSTAAPGAPDLYEYDVETGKLSDLTVDGNTGEHANVQGVLGTSRDGSYVYFAADGVLAAGATPGEPNLYVLHNGGSGWEAAKFIATVEPGDGNEVPPAFARYGFHRYGDWVPALDNRSAEVSADGQGLVFSSSRSIPVVGFPNGYRNEGLFGSRLAEVYAYQAGEAGGRLFCVSCNSSGEPPQQNFETEAGKAAAFLPIGFDPTRQPRWISEDGGRVFFDSAEPLVPTDTNGQQDVYEWERDGTGSCHEVDGCVYLLSDGVNEDASYLLDASVNGDDAFIITRARLTPSDRNELYEVYDARVGGSSPAQPPACTGTGCQGVPAPPPTFATPPSATFNGVGNFAPPPPAPPTHKSKPKPKACKQGYARKSGKCVKKHAAKKVDRARKAGHR